MRSKPPLGPFATDGRREPAPLQQTEHCRVREAHSDCLCATVGSCSGANGDQRAVPLPVLQMVLRSLLFARSASQAPTLALTGFARKVVLSGFEVFSAVSAYLCYLCVKYSRDYSYAEITEIRRGHREESESCKKHSSCKAASTQTSVSLVTATFMPSQGKVTITHSCCF